MSFYIVGQVISTPAIFNDEVRLRSRFSYDCILAQTSWNSLVLLSHEAIDEMTFWLDNIEKLNEQGADLCHLTNKMIEDVDIYCDASKVGFDGHWTIHTEGESFDSTRKSVDLKGKSFDSERRSVDSIVQSIYSSSESGSQSWSSFERTESSTWRELEAGNEQRWLHHRLS